MAELTTRWDEKKLGKMSRGALVRVVADLEIGATDADAERSSRFSPPRRAPLGGKGELDVKKLVKMAFEWVAKATEEAAAKNAQLSSLARRASCSRRATWRAVRVWRWPRRRSRRRHCGPEKEAAKEAARAAKEAKKAAAAKKKAEQKAAFEAKVALKRKDASLLQAAPSPAPTGWELSA